MKLLPPLTTAVLGLFVISPSPAATELSQKDWTGIRAAHENWNHRIAAQPDGTHAAQAVGQGWTVTFDGRGFLATPGNADWTWGLELANVGDPVGDARIARSEENRLVVRHDETLAEWFVNRPSGLQQGWTLTGSPAGQSGDQPKRLDLAVRGSLTPVVSANSVQFADADGSTILTYGGLLAWDADGRKLPVQFVAASKPDRFAIEFDDREARYPITIDPVAQQASLKASNAGPADYFGYSVAVSGDTVVVGAWLESSNATGVDGDETDNSAANSGAAYVFVRSGSTWTQQAYLKASNAEEDDNFGFAVAVSGDTALITAGGEDSEATGADGDETDNSTGSSGAAYVFTRSGSIWSQQAYLKASNPEPNARFGETAALSGDTAVVGTTFERSNATGINGNQMDRSEPQSGAAYVFARSGGTWSQQAYLKASNSERFDRFGISVAVSGDTIIVGAFDEDSAASEIGGDETDNSAQNAGAAYVFQRLGFTWFQQAYLKASNADVQDRFGKSVAVSGDTALVGAYREGSNATGADGNQADNSVSASGAAYVFVRSGSTWSQQSYLKASNTGADDEFGTAVALSGNVALVGASAESSAAIGVGGVQSNDSALRSGAAYLFERAGTTWSQSAYLKASNTGAGDNFGFSVAASGDTIVVGAFQEDSGTPGINNPLIDIDNSADAAGAAYAFLIPSLTPPTVPPTSGVADRTSPDIQFRGRKRVESTRKRVVFRGTASDVSGIAKVEFKASGVRGGFQDAKGPGTRWRAIVRPNDRRSQTVVKIRAVDAAGNRSKILKLRIIRR